MADDSYRSRRVIIREETSDAAVKNQRKALVEVRQFLNTSNPFLLDKIPVDVKDIDVAIAALAAACQDMNQPPDLRAAMAHAIGKVAEIAERHGLYINITTENWDQLRDPLIRPLQNSTEELRVTILRSVEFFAQFNVPHGGWVLDTPATPGDIVTPLIEAQILNQHSSSAVVSIALRIFELCKCDAASTAVPVLTPLLKSPDADVRQRVCEFFAWLGIDAAAAVHDVISVILDDHEVTAVKLAATRAIVRMLDAVKGEDDVAVKDQAAQAIVQQKMTNATTTLREVCGTDARLKKLIDQLRVIEADGRPLRRALERKPPSEEGPAKTHAGEEKKKRNRPVNHEKNKRDKEDAQISAAWETDRYKTYEELALALRKQKKEVEDALDRVRKRKSARRKKEDR